MNYIGLDLSLTSSGFCILRAKGGIAYVIRYGIINPKTLRDMERIVFIENKIRKLCLAYKIQGVGMEGHAIYSRQGKMMDRTELAGVVKRYLFVNGLEPTILEPKHMKKVMTGYGNSDKERMVKTVRGIAGLQFNKVAEGKVDNVADAYSAAYCALAKDGHIRIAHWRFELMEG